jgi:CRP-like cAMP-binding protein
MHGCASCAIGQASGVGRGGACPFVVRRRQAGEHLFHQGDPAASVWYIRSGTIALLRELPGGEGVHAIRGAGALVGLEILVDGAYADSARALTDLSACGLPRAAVDVWLGDRSSPARVVLEQVLRGLAADAPRGAAPDGNATSRVARWILEAGPAPAVPRRMVASMLGMVPETLSRALAQLRKDGAIVTTRRTITIRDRLQLARAAGADAPA